MTSFLIVDLRLEGNVFLFIFFLVGYTSQGQVAEAESMFNTMKIAGCCPDVVAYTAMLHAYNTAGNAEYTSLLTTLETANMETNSGYMYNLYEEMIY